jgi:hypothetical protein
MHIDPVAVRPGDEADVESEGGPVRRKSKSQTPKGNKASPKAEETMRDDPIEIPDEDEKQNENDGDNVNDDGDGDDDDDDEGDEEVFAVEKVLNHRISTKKNVMRTVGCVLTRYLGSKSPPILYQVAWL